MLGMYEVFFLQKLPVMFCNFGKTGKPFCKVVGWQMRVFGSFSIFLKQNSKCSSLAPDMTKLAPLPCSQTTAGHLPCSQIVAGWHVSTAGGLRTFPPQASTFLAWIGSVAGGFRGLRARWVPAAVTFLQFRVSGGYF